MNRPCSVAALIVFACAAQGQSTFLIQGPTFRPAFFPKPSANQKLTWAKKWGITKKLVVAAKPTFVRLDARSSYNAALDAGIGGVGVGWFGNTNAIFLQPPMDIHTGHTVIPTNEYKTFFVIGTKFSPSKTYLVLMHLQVIQAGTVKISNGVTVMDWPLQKGLQTIPIVLPAGESQAEARLTNTRTGIVGWVQDASIETLGG